MNKNRIIRGALLALLVVGSSLLALSPAQAAGAGDPPGCTGTSTTLGIFNKPSLIESGDTVLYAVRAQNTQAGACNWVGANVTHSPPAADGNPGTPQTLATGVDLPFNSSPVSGVCYYAPGAADLCGNITTQVQNASLAHAVTVNSNVVAASSSASTTCNNCVQTPNVNSSGNSQVTTPVAVIHPNTTLIKNASAPKVKSGSTVTYTYNETNNGVEPPGTNFADLFNPTVTDDKCGPVTPTNGDTNGDSILNVGETWTFSCTTTLTTTTTNTAIGSGFLSSQLPNPALANKQITFPQYPGERANATVTVFTSSISLTKTPNSSKVRSGSTVTYTYNVTNTGTVVLSNVSITDNTSVSPNPVTSGQALNPGQTKTFTATSPVITINTTNRATATGTDQTGATVSANATAFVRVINSSISLTKDPNSSKVVSGSKVTYTYNVTNTGTSVLNNVRITDNTSVSPNPIIVGTLNPGEKKTFTATSPVLTINTTNLATANGTDQLGANVSAQATAFVRVINPNIIVNKTCSPKSQSVPGTITWTIVTNNTGNVTLTVTLTDTRSTIGTIPIGPLTPGASNTTTKVESNLPAGNYTNTVTATGNHQLGSVSNTSSATCSVIAPLANISGYKINDTNANGFWDPGELGIQGWNITLSNNTMTLTNVTDANGFFKFSNLAPGNYILKEEDRVNWTHTNASSKSITLAGIDLTNLNFTNNFKPSICPVVPGVPGSISGCKFNDLNGNGKRDPGEPGLANWTIRLSGYDTSDRRPVSRRTVTDANGFYQFTNVTPGFYILCENSKPDWKPTSSPCKFVRLPNQTASAVVDFANVCTPSRTCPPT